MISLWGREIVHTNTGSPSPKRRHGRISVSTNASGRGALITLHPFAVAAHRLIRLGVRVWEHRSVFYMEARRVNQPAESGFSS